jgi:long-chain acyl-CoA synthetase
VHLCGAVCVPLEASTPRERQQQIRDELNGKFSPPKGGRGGSDILYTTGTTGAAKGVILSTEAWKANAENLIDRLGFASGLLFIVCGPLNHLGSLSKIYPTLMTGSTLYLLENLKDLGAFFSIFEMPFSRFATFLVPSSIRMLLQFARKNLQPLPRRWISSKQVQPPSLSTTWNSSVRFYRIPVSSIPMPPPRRALSVATSSAATDVVQGSLVAR